MRMREYTAMNNNKSYLQSHTFVNILKILTYMLYISYSGKVFFASYTLQVLTFVIAEASLVLTVVIYIAILLLYYILQHIYFVFSSTLNACAGIKISRVTVYTINSW